jgi:Flp pilus assembly secretin CpaC
MKPTAFLCAVWLLAAPAFANPLKQISLPVGHSMTMAMPAPVTAVEVSDPSLVEVRREGRKVTLVALSRGNTEATVKTADGEHRFRVYVAIDKYALPQ